MICQIFWGIQKSFSTKQNKSLSYLDAFTSVNERLLQMAENDVDLEIRHQAKIALGELDPFKDVLNLGRRELEMREANESLENNRAIIEIKNLPLKKSTTTIQEPQHQPPMAEEEEIMDGYFEEDEIDVSGKNLEERQQQAFPTTPEDLLLENNGKF